MRFILALVLLSSCAPASPPQAELAGGEPALSEMTYHCSESGVVVLRIETESETIEHATEDACDPEAWARDVAENGPVYSRRSQRMNYAEWIAQREASAADAAP